MCIFFPFFNNCINSFVNSVRVLNVLTNQNIKNSNNRIEELLTGSPLRQVDPAGPRGPGDPCQKNAIQVQEFEQEML